jgi:hypothetical protein
MPSPWRTSTRRGDWNAIIEASEYAPWRLECHSRGGQAGSVAGGKPQRGEKVTFDAIGMPLQGGGGRMKVTSEMSAGGARRATEAIRLPLWEHHEKPEGKGICWRKNGRAAQHRVAADRLAARKIGPFLRCGICASPSVGGVGEGRKAAAEPWSLGRPHQRLLPVDASGCSCLRPSAIRRSFRV